MENKSREQWSSKIGFILAAAGSAVGLGNIWKFPYTAGENGGGAFIIIYLVFSFIIGISIMLGEFVIGRMTGVSTFGAYKKVDRRFTFVGVLGVLTAFLIMGFYPVVGGWSLAYVFKSFDGLLSSSSNIPNIFESFISDPFEPIFWLFLYLGLNIAIVAKGVSQGIEKASKILMPTLFVILILLGIRSVTLPGSSAGLDFLFKPDWSAVTGQTVLAALGQAFFSLSLGMGCMITYGSYLKKEENLIKNATIITALDSSVAILAGVAIFPALFAFNMEPAAGPGLVFVVVPQVFANFSDWLGVMLSFIFFLALTVAALTSSVSLLETASAYLIDEKKMARSKAVGLAAGGMVFLSLLSSLSMGVMSGSTILGATVFDFLSLITDKVFLAVGAALMAIFLGWFVDKKAIKQEISNMGQIKVPFFNIWYGLIKYIIPIAVFAVAYMGISSSPSRGVMVFAIAMVVGLFFRSRNAEV